MFLTQYFTLCACLIVFLCAAFFFSQSDGYDPNKSKVSDDTLKAFVESELQPNLDSVPGVGPVTVKWMEDNGIENTYQLVAKYMAATTTQTVQSEDGENVEIVDVFTTNNHFWHFLKDLGVRGARSGIVNAINQKVASWDTNYVDTTPYDQM